MTGVNCVQLVHEESLSFPVSFFWYYKPGFLADVFDVPRFWKLKKFLQRNRWLESWLRRELQALMQVRLQFHLMDLAFFCAFIFLLSC